MLPICLNQNACDFEDVGMIHCLEDLMNFYYLPENVHAENHVHVVEEGNYQDMLNYCHDYQKNSIYIRNTL